MASSELRATVLRNVAVGFGAAVVLFGVALFVDFPLLLLGMLMVGIPLFVVPAMVGLTDVGIETAAASARIGASTGQPEQYQTGSLLPIPNKLQVVCWLSGVGVVGAVLLATVA
jgi:hypothetical protein